jgi:acetylornithine deacetylase
MITNLEEKVLSAIDAETEQLIGLLQSLLHFRTVTPETGQRAENDEFIRHQEYVAALLGELGLSTETWEIEASTLERFPGCGVFPDRDLHRMPVVVGRLPGTGTGSSADSQGAGPAPGLGRSLILNGHYDVVPVGRMESWRYEPFAAVLEKGRIYGRGACDMKAGIAAMITALRCIREAGVRLRGEVTLQVVPDEEQSSMGTLACCQRGYRADAALIPEPTDMRVLVAMRGSHYCTVTVRGRAGHAEEPQRHWRQGGAVNAISKAVKVLTALEELATSWQNQPERKHPLLEADTLLPTVIRGGQWSVTVPEEVEIQFSGMHIPGSEGHAEAIQRALERVAAQDPWLRAHPPILRMDENLYGAEIPESEAVVQEGLQILEDLGYPGGVRGFGSLTDAVHLINFARIPTMSIGPDSHTAHCADEFVTVDQLLDTAKVVALSLLRWCG